jgi:hypothetical protein
MCLMLYLGTDAPVPGFDAVAPGEVGLDHGPGPRPVGLSDKGHVALVADRLAEGWNCSCVFLDGAQAWDDTAPADDPEAMARRDAFAALRRIVEAALGVDADALLLSCWSGEEDRLPVIERRLGISDLQADRFLFADVADGGTEGNPPVLIRFSAADGGAPCSERS